MLIFDVETGPLPEDQLRQQFDGQFQPPPHPGEFDPASVKFGNLKDPAKRDAKVEECRAAHEVSVRDYESRVAQARESWWSELTEKAALSPITGRVLAIGMRSAESGKVGIDGGDDEASMIDKFWAKYRKCREQSRRLCGFNILGFDVPFLIRRSWLLGVDVPDTVFERGRYLDSLVFVDLMQIWGCGGRDMVKLDTLAQAFGLGGKPEGVNGGDFARLWATDRDQAVAYLTNDLDMTAKLAERMGLVA